jgi:hypothetical protein
MVVATLLLVVVALVLASGCEVSSNPPQLGSGEIPTLSGGGGPCGPNGVTAQCHVSLGTYGGVAMCADGTMTCQGGAWGPCMTSGTRTASDPGVITTHLDSFGPTLNGGLHGLAIVATSSSCTNDPCDPNCWMFADQPDAALQGDVVRVSAGMFTGFGQLPSGNPPSGFQNNADDYANICSEAACSPANMATATDTSIGTTSSACQAACQFGSQCSGNGCVMFGAGATGSCQGVDLSTPIACDTSSGAHRLELCNTGTDDVPANSGIVCYAYAGSSPAYPSTNCASDSDCPPREPMCMGAPAGTSLGICMPALGTLIDTFNEAIPHGTCVTHTPTTWPSSGTESLYCNARVSSTIDATYPSATTYAFPTTTPSAGSWTTTNGAYQVGGSTAQLSFVSSTAGPVPAGGVSGDSGGWSNEAGMLTATPGGAPATVDVADAFSSIWPAVGSPSTVATTGTWTTPTNADTATGTAGQYASAVVAVATTSSTPVESGTTATADSALTTPWTTLTNAQGSPDGASASISVPSRADAGLYLSYSGFGAAPPAGAKLVGATAQVYWMANSIKVQGTLELYNSAGTLIATGTPSAVAATTGAITATTFTFTQAQLAAMSTNDLASTNANLVHFWVHNSGTLAHTVYVDAITIEFSYQVTPTLTLTNFGISVPSDATITSVVVQVGVGEAASNTNAQVQVQAYQDATTLSAPYATTAATQTPTTAIAAETLTLDGSGGTTIPAATDLTSSNFGVVISPSVSSGTFTLDVEYVSVTVNYTEANNQYAVLSGFGFQDLIPPTAVIDTVKLDVDWKINGGSSDSAATLTAQPYSGATPIATGISVTPTPSYATNSATYTNTSGAIGYSDLVDGTFYVIVGASTTGAGFQASIDMVRITVTYTVPSTSTMTLGGFNLGSVVTGPTTLLTVTAGWDVSTASAGTQICFQPFNGATAIGAAECTTSGASPPTSITEDSATYAWLGGNDFTNFSVEVTATHSPGGTPTTVSVDYVEAQVNDVTLMTTGVAECDYQNNWSVAEANPALLCPTIPVGYGAFQYSRVFSATCPTGTRPQWQLFGWDSSEPSDSTIAFRFRSFDVSDGGTCTALPGVFSGTSPAPLVTAESTPNDTQTCSVTQNPPTATCPGGLYTYLGGLPGANYPCLQMDVDGEPSSSGTSTPTLTDWTATYDCLPSE